MVESYPRNWSWVLQERQIERREYHNNPDVCDQPLQEVMPEEQDVHADDDRHHRDDVKHDGGPCSRHSKVLKLTMLSVPSWRLQMSTRRHWERTDRRSGSSSSNYSPYMPLLFLSETCVGHV